VTIRFDRPVNRSTPVRAHAETLRRYRRWSRKQLPSDLAIPYPWDQDRDRQVIEAAIVGWLDRKDENDERLDPDGRNWRVVIDRSTAIDPWEQIGSVEHLAEHGFPGELATAVERRNAAPVSLEQFKFSDPRIVIDNVMKLIRADSPRDYRLTCVTITLPAYSRDGNLAVLAIALYGTTHGSRAIFGVEHLADHWHLRWEYFSAGE
jgi:hypothetical protein